MPPSVYNYFVDHIVDVPGIGEVLVDIVYGGAFYAIVPASRLGIDIEKSSAQDMKMTGGAVTGDNRTFYAHTN